MALFIISYDQHRDRDYTPIWTLLRQWGAKRVLESLWLADLNATAGQVRDALTATTAGRDSIVVIQLIPKSDWGTSAGCQSEGVEWLQQHL